MQLVVGRITRPHGVRGELTVEVRTDDPELRLAAGTVLRTEPATAGPLTIAGTRWHSGRLLVRFANVDDRTAAESLRGTLLLVDAASLEDLPDPDSYRDHQLVGLTVVGPGEAVVGSITDVLHHGQDLLVVAGSGPQAGTEILIPFVAAIVTEVDLDAGLVRVDPPAGLLDPEAAI
jgi:16S rRNA processing protein RimM